MFGTWVLGLILPSYGATARSHSRSGLNVLCPSLGSHGKQAISSRIRDRQDVSCYFMHDSRAGGRSFPTILGGPSLRGWFMQGWGSFSSFRMFCGVPSCGALRSVARPFFSNPGILGQLYLNRHFDQLPPRTPPATVSSEFVEAIVHAFHTFDLPSTPRPNTAPVAAPSPRSRVACGKFRPLFS